ncbi:ABC transporter ATP-binding protein [Pseudomonas aeruginosa]|nr:ABC transporter ATP-binding protein [Pseudomonas aeruginosa]AYR15308.1 ABC transporter ATP-binding protein [Pseudomonas aeruginosa]
MTPVLWRLLRTYRWRLAAAMGLQALAGLCSLLPWMLLAWLAEPLARGQAQPALLALVLLAVLAWLGCQALAAHLAHRVDADLCNDLRLRLLAHLQRLPLDWFGRQGPDGVARLVEQDVRALHQLIAHAPNDLSNLLVVPLVALLWLAWLHPWLLLFCLLPLVLAVAGFLLLRSARYRDLVLRRNAALERLSADYGEFAHNLLLARQYPGAGIQQGAEASAAAFGEAFGAWVKRVGHLAALVYVQLSTLGCWPGSCSARWSWMPSACRWRSARPVPSCSCCGPWPPRCRRSATAATRCWARAPPPSACSRYSTRRRWPRAARPASRSMARWRCTAWAMPMKTWRSWPISIWSWRMAAWWPWSAPRAPARAPCCTCWRATWTRSAANWRLAAWH